MRTCVGGAGEAAGTVVVRTELSAGPAQTDSLQTRAVENIAPGKVMAVVDEDLLKLSVDAERTSEKSEGAQHTGTEDEVMSKRAKS